MLWIVLLKVRYMLAQNGPGTVRLGYGLTGLLDVPVRLRVTVQTNMNQLKIVCKRVAPVWPMNGPSF